MSAGAAHAFLTDAAPGRPFRLRPVVLATSGPVLLVLSFGVGNRWLALVGCLVLAALVVAAATTPRTSALAVAVRVPARAAVGDVVEHVVTVHNTGAKDCAPVVLHLRGDAFEDVHTGVPALASGAAVELRLPRTALRRAHSTGPLVVVEAGDALGIVVQRRSGRPAAEVFVHPVPTLVPQLPAAASRAGSDDVAGIRPFRVGDPASAVHWRASARRAAAGPPGPGALVVVEREATPTGVLVLVLNTVGDAVGDGLEPLLGQAAALVARERAAGRRVGVLDGGARLREGAEALDVLAAALPRPQVEGQLEGQLTVARRLAGRDGRVVVASATAEPSWRTA